MVTIGWEWTYVNSDPTYSIKLEPFIKTVASVQNEFNLAKFMYANFQFDLVPFKSNMFYMLTANPSQTCFGIGYSTEAITLRLYLNYYFMNCYKKIIANMADYTDSWTGTDAKWIDECTFPYNTAIIKIFENTYTESISDNAIIGGTSANQAGCFKYGSWTSWAPYLLSYGNLFLKGMGIATPDLDYEGKQHFSSPEFDLY